MSGTGIISQEYHDAAELFRGVNSAVVLLKKSHYKLPGAKRVKEYELDESRRVLSSVINQLVARLDKADRGDAGKEQGVTGVAPRVPPLFARRLRERHSGDLQWYVQDLDELIGVLKKNEGLTSDQLAHLDELCSQLDAETTSLYRKLWRY